MTETTAAPLAVFLVPLGGDRYELYSEVADVPPDDREGRDGGRFAGMRATFRSMLSMADAQGRARRAGTVDAGARSWSRRARDAVMGSVAEAVAEQRLLWNLRSQAEASLVHPDDMPEARATEMLREALRRDVDKHRLWFGVDLAAFGASGLLALIPGPNLIAYYFAFRLVGHFFSLRGARHGLAGARWHTRASPELSDLRRALELPRAERDARLQSLAERLDLHHLAAFVDRITV